MGVEQKRGEEKQRFQKRRDKLSQGMDALKKGGAGIPLRNYDVTSILSQDFFIYFYLSIVYFTLTIVILQ